MYHHEKGKRGGTMLPGIGIIANVAAIALGGVLGLGCVGNILIFAIGTNLLGLPNIRVANFLPALVIAALWGMG